MNYQPPSTKNRAQIVVAFLKTSMNIGGESMATRWDRGLSLKRAEYFAIVARSITQDRIEVDVVSNLHNSDPTNTDGVLERRANQLEG